MDIKIFIESIQFAILAERFTVTQATEYLRCNNWHTACDVPVDRRAKMLEDLIG